ncbi:MAG: HNH endonuclease [Hyphomicrobiaceae bacterium]
MSSYYGSQLEAQVEQLAKFAIEAAEELKKRGLPDLRRRLEKPIEYGAGWHVEITKTNKDNIVFCLWIDNSFREKLIWVGVSSSKKSCLQNFMESRLSATRILKDEDANPDETKYWRDEIIQSLKPLFRNRLGPGSPLIQESYRGEHYLGSLVSPELFSAIDAADLCKHLLSGKASKSPSEHQSDFDREVDEAASDWEALRKRLEKAPAKPRRVCRLIVEFARNPDVVTMRLHIAQGRCEGCNSLAPFKRRDTGAPYLEVHHIIPLAGGGDDTVENTTALCPNCHRKAHYGE